MTYYKFDQLLGYLKAKDSFYLITPIEMAALLKELPSNLAMKVIYSEIAEMLLNKEKDKMTQIATVTSDYGVTIPSDPKDVKKNIDKYLMLDHDKFEKSVVLLMKSASLEDGDSDNIEVTQEEYDFIKDDFLEREKYELINKMTII